MWYHYNNSTVYYYITNLQGDVVHLVDGSGAVVASYEYDPYGNIVSSTGAMAEINPLRYRGYYYDSDTGFYYLQSRYYDPKICRFINADSYASTGQGVLGNNMFAYCNNSPVGSVDPWGERLQSAISLLDYYFIHKLVQMDIVGTYGYAMEVYVRSASGKRGFLDLYDYVLNQYYEVKHADYSIAATETQMSMYDTSSIKSWMFDEYTLGGSPTRGTNMAISGSLVYKTYSIEYYVVAPGLIHYTIDLVPQKQLSMVSVPIPHKKRESAFVMAGCFFLGGGGAPFRGAFGRDLAFELAYTY